MPSLYSLGGGIDCISPPPPQKKQAQESLAALMSLYSIVTS